MKNTINVNNYIHFRRNDTDTSFGYIVNMTIEDEHQIEVIDADTDSTNKDPFTKDSIKIPFKKNHPKFNESIYEVLKLHKVIYVVDKELYNKVVECEREYKRDADSKKSFLYSEISNANVFSLKNWIEANKLFS